MNHQTLVTWLVDPRLPANISVGFTARRANISFPPADRAEYAGLNLGFHVGDDAQRVAENRARLEAEVGEPMTWMDQVHGAHVAEASSATASPHGNTVGQADAVIVRGSGAAAVMVADCVPLVLADTVGRCGAVVHVGRAGLEKGIAAKVVRALGIAPTDLIGFIGPAICGKCYEVPRSMAAAVGAHCPGAESTTSWGTPAIDIKNALAEQLTRVGTAVVDTHQCTYENTDYYSHRRREPGKQTGRFAGIIRITRLPSDTPA